MSPDTTLSCRRRDRRPILAVWSFSTILAVVEASRGSQLWASTTFVVSRQQPLALRGGSSTGGGSNGSSAVGGGGGGGGESSVGDISDDELDEYIDFLLAAAEDEVTEEDNPLFQRFRRSLAKETEEQQAQEEEISLTSKEELNGSEEEFGVVENQTPDSKVEASIDTQEISTPSTESSESTITVVEVTPADEEDERMTPMVVDEEDEDQLDDMIETLISTVSDDEEEEEEEDKVPAPAEGVEEEIQVIPVETTVASTKADHEDQVPSIPVDESTDTEEEEEEGRKEFPADATIESTQVDHENEVPYIPVKESTEDVAIESIKANHEDYEVPYTQDSSEDEVEETVDEETEFIEEPFAVLESTSQNEASASAEAAPIVQEEEEEVEESIDEVQVSIHEEASSSTLESQVVDESVAMADNSVQQEEEEKEEITLPRDEDSRNSPETSIAEAEEHTQDRQTPEPQHPEEEVPRLVLGPSAVGDSPPVKEEPTTEAEGVAIQVDEQTQRVDSNMEPVPHLVDLASEPITEGTIVEAPADQMSKTTSMLKASMQLWGKWTSRIIGIESKTEIAPVTSNRYAMAWGKLTASAMGISKGSDDRSQRTSLAKYKAHATSSRDFDRIYYKYYAQYAPAPTKHSNTVSDDSLSGEQKDTSAKSAGRVSRLWGNIGRIINYERSKPIPLLSGTLEDQEEATDRGDDGSEIAVDVRNSTMQVEADVEESPTHEETNADNPLSESFTETANEEEPMMVDSVISVDQVDSKGSVGDEVLPFASDGLVTPEAEKEDIKTDETSENGEGVLRMTSLENADEAARVEDDSDSSENESMEEMGDSIEHDIKHPSASEARVAPADDEDDATEADLVTPRVFQKEMRDNEQDEPKNDNAGEDLTTDETGGTKEDEISEGGVAEAIEEYDQYDEYEEDYDTLQVPEVESTQIHAEEYDIDEVDDDEEVPERGMPALPADFDGNYRSASAKAKSSINFFYRFLIVRGLDAWLMTIVLFFEWCRVYLAPFAGDLLWLTKFSRADPRVDRLRESILAKLRGGSDSGGFSDSGKGDDKMSSTGGSVVASSAKSSISQADVSDKPKGQSDGNMHSTVPRSRPNLLYRHLFSYGRIGHVLIMECVLFNEWVNMYVPAVSAAISWAAHQAFPGWTGKSDTFEMPLSHTTGFVGADGSAVRGAKKKAAQTRKEDEKALSQLKRIGDVSQAKYRFLSHHFMKRHGIGPFSEEKPAADWGTSGKPKKSQSSKAAKKRPNEDVESESDNEWILSALTKDNQLQAEKDRFEPAGNVPTMTVGMEVGNRKRSKRGRSSISDVSRLTSQKQTRKVTGPRLSDRESGVMGRIRSAGANSLVGRNLLGAYPGDAPPPSEAANVHGLYELAEKYGYGDWSDNDCEGDDVATFPSPKPSKKKKKRRRGQRIGLEFDFTSKSSSNTSTRRVTPARLKSMDDTVNTKGEWAQDSRSTKRTKSVAQAGLDAFEQRAKKESKETRSGATLSSSDSAERIQQAKPGPRLGGSVLDAGLQEMKDKRRDSE